VVSPVHQDPFWDNLLKPVVSLAESIPLTRYRLPA
jgi:hypothetical protein